MEVSNVFGTKVGLNFEKKKLRFAVYSQFCSQASIFKIKKTKLIWFKVKFLELNIVDSGVPGRSLEGRFVERDFDYRER